MQKQKDLSGDYELNMAVSESETKINEIYSEIGYKVYCAYQGKSAGRSQRGNWPDPGAGRGYGSMQTADPGNQCNEQFAHELGL